MINYEMLLLTRIEITEDDSSMLENSFDKIISDSGGKLLTFDRWGKYRLAYPVKKNNHGVYILLRYELPSEKTHSTNLELNDFLKIKCNEIVMRNITIKLDPDAPLTYQKPDIEDSSSRSSLDKFFKENKIENLLNSVESTKVGPGRESVKTDFSGNNEKEDSNLENNDEGN
jgi:small subunit ribosomal protein S6